MTRLDEILARVNGISSANTVKNEELEKPDLAKYSNGIGTVNSNGTSIKPSGKADPKKLEELNKKWKENNKDSKCEFGINSDGDYELVNTGKNESYDYDSKHKCYESAMMGYYRIQNEILEEFENIKEYVKTYEKHGHDTKDFIGRAKRDLKILRDCYRKLAHS